jgi:hypothetical protein
MSDVWVFLACSSGTLPIAVVRAVTPTHLNVARMAIVGGAMSLGLGAVIGFAWIAIFRKRMMMQRDLDLERRSILLRQSRRWGKLVASGMVLAGVIASLAAVSYYPNPNPVPENGITPEQDAILGLLLGWLLLAMGVSWLIRQLYWDRVLKNASREAHEISRPRP